MRTGVEAGNAIGANRQWLPARCLPVRSRRLSQAALHGAATRNGQELSYSSRPF